MKDIDFIKEVATEARTLEKDITKLASNRRILDLLGPDNVDRLNFYTELCKFHQDLTKILKKEALNGKKVKKGPKKFKTVGRISIDVQTKLANGAK